jgi:hypothetical protein
MTVYLAASEAEEAIADPKFHENLLASMRKQARAKGRRFVELIAPDGSVISEAAS